MKKNIWTYLYCIGLMLSGLIGLVTGICGIAGIQLPDIAARMIGVVSLVGIALLSASIAHYIITKNKKE